MKIIVLKFDFFGPFFGPLLAFFDIFAIGVILSPYLKFLIFCNYLQFSAIFVHFYHFLAIGCPFWGICILIRINAFKPIFKCFSHCINLLSLLAIIISHFYQFLAKYRKLVRLFLPFSEILSLFLVICRHIYHF